VAAGSVAAARSRGVVRETAGLAALSVLSPTAGLAVEMALAWRFGASPAVDAYRVTVLLILFGQQMFVTSVLPYAVVPLFAECRARDKEADAWAAADSLALLLAGFGVAAALALFLWPGLAASLLAPGLAGEGREQAVFLLRWSGLALIPVCWSAVAYGVLYAYEVFRAAPLAQFVANLTLLLAILLGGARAGPANLAIGLVGGATASACLCGFMLTGVRRRFSPQRAARTSGLWALRKLFRLAAPLAAGVAVGQLSGAVMARSLSRLATGSLAVFGYSWKLGQLVLLTPTALSTVLFPKLSGVWHSHGSERFKADYTKALRAVFLIATALTGVVYFLREPIVRLLLARGALSAAAAETTAALFGLLILGAPANAAVTCLDRVFYAVQETKAPVAVDIGAALVAMALVPLLAPRFGATGVACVYMLLPWLAGGLLWAMFEARQ
jgi:putative peptidoglycan lipid II flippase